MSHLGYTFQVLPQGYLPSLTTCHGTVAKDLSLFSFLTSVEWPLYTDDIMLTCEDVSLLQKTSQAFLDHLQQRARAVKLQEIQGPVTTVRFLGVI